MLPPPRETLLEKEKTKQLTTEPKAFLQITIQYRRKIIQWHSETAVVLFVQ